MSFDGDTVPADGILPMGEVTLDSNGYLYGATLQRGTNGDGIVYEYSSSGALNTLVTFSGANGHSPEGNLVFDTSGNPWGITDQGASFGYGGAVVSLSSNSGSASVPMKDRWVTPDLRAAVASLLSVLAIAHSPVPPARTDSQVL